jgi:hypothetical protein
MRRVLPFALAILLQLDLRRAAGDFDFGAIIQIVADRTLKPRHFSVLFSHIDTNAEFRMQNAERISFCILHSSL